MSDLSDALATCRTIWATLADEGWEYGYGLNALDAVMAAARLVSEAPEWLQQLLEDGYHLESPTLGDVILLKVPPNSEDILDLAEALRDALDRQVIVLEEGWDLDTADVIEWCDFHKAGGTPGFDCWGAGLDGQDSCRMVRRRLLKPEHAAD